MRTDGHGLAQASCRFGPDDSHGVAMPVTNSGALPSSSSISISNSQSIHSLGRLLPDIASHVDSIATRHKAWTEYQDFICIAAMSWTAKTAAARKIILTFSPSWTEDEFFVSNQTQFEFYHNEAVTLREQWVANSSALM